MFVCLFFHPFVYLFVFMKFVFLSVCLLWTNCHSQNDERFSYLVCKISRWRYMYLVQVRSQVNQWRAKVNRRRSNLSRINIHILKRHCHDKNFSFGQNFPGNTETSYLWYHQDWSLPDTQIHGCWESPRYLFYIQQKTFHSL